NVLYALSLEGKLPKNFSSNPGSFILILSLGASIYGLTGYIFLRLVNRTSREIKSYSRFFYLSYNLTRLVFFGTALILILILIQSATTGHYSVILTVASMSAGFVIECIIMGMLGYKFLS